MKRFRIVVDTGFAGAQHEDEIEFSDEEWEAMTEQEREDVLSANCQQVIENHIEAYAEEIQ